MNPLHGATIRVRLKSSSAWARLTSAVRTRTFSSPGTPKVAFAWSNAALADASAARIHNALGVLFKDQTAIEASLSGASDKDRAAIARAYEVRFGHPLKDALSERERTLLKAGRLSEAERLHYAIDGLGNEPLFLYIHTRVLRLFDAGCGNRRSESTPQIVR